MASSTSLMGLSVGASFALAFATALILYLVHDRWKWRHYYNCLSKLDGPKSLPLIGHCHLALGRPHEVLEILSKEFIDKHEEPVLLYLGPVAHVLISDPESYKIVFTSAKCIGKSNIYDGAKSLLGDGLFTASASVWKTTRSRLATTFNPRVLNNYGYVFYESAVNFVKELADNRDGNVDILKRAISHFFACVCQTSMGTEMNDTQKFAEYFDLLKPLIATAQDRVVNPLYFSDFVYFNLPAGRRAMKLYNQLMVLTNEVIEEKRAAMKRNPISSNDDVCFTEEHQMKFKSFLELLLELEGDDAFTDEQVRDEVVTLLIAAVDTCGLSISFLLTMLGMHPDIQERVYNESIETFGIDGTIEYADLSKLKYTERCINETMRLFPVAPVKGRHVADDVKIKGKTIPAGSNVMMHVYHTHRSAKYWPDPLKFDPDRFLPEEVAKRHPYAHVPYAAGPRNCIGTYYGKMLLKTFIAHIIRNFKVTTPYKTVEEIKVTVVLMIKPVDGFKVGFVPREN